MPITQDTEVTRVIFRVCKTEPQKGEVIALFPDAPWVEGRRNLVSSYMHVGQHGAALYQGVIADTRPAKPEEYAALKRELETDIGYNLKGAKRR